MRLSARNQINARVTGITRGEATANVRLDAGGTRLVASITVEAAEELAELDVFCVEPTDGQALVPFVYDDQLAWYLFDVFEERKPLRYWRFDNDPADTRRPITPLQKGEAGIVQVG